MLLFLCLPGLPLAAQISLPSLLVDSTASKSWNDLGEGQTFILEIHGAFSYDNQGRIQEERQTDHRTHYTYHQDTVFSWSEKWSTQNTWDSSDREICIYTDGKMQSSRTETYSDHRWQDQRLRTYSYNSAGQQILSVAQRQENKNWIEFSRNVAVYDAQGNQSSAEISYTEGGVNYKEGFLYAYDPAGHKVQEIKYFGTSQDPRYIDKSTWRYGKDDLVDTFQRFVYGNGGFKNEILDTYQYYGQDSIVRSSQRWQESGWQLVGKEMIFPGPQMYGAEPDSSIFYRYEPEHGFVPKMRHTYHYQNLGNKRIYYLEQEFHRNRESNVWDPSSSDERWYRVK